MNEGHNDGWDPAGLTDRFAERNANDEFLASVYDATRRNPDWARKVTTEMKKERKIAALPRKERQREMAKLAERRERMRDPNGMSRRDRDDALMRKYCGLK